MGVGEEVRAVLVIPEECPRCREGGSWTVRTDSYGIIAEHKCGEMVRGDIPTLYSIDPVAFFGAGFASVVLQPEPVPCAPDCLTRQPLPPGKVGAICTCGAEWRDKA